MHRASLFFVFCCFSGLTPFVQGTAGVPIGVLSVRSKNIAWIYMCLSYRNKRQCDNLESENGLSCLTLLVDSAGLYADIVSNKDFVMNFSNE